MGQLYCQKLGQNTQENQNMSRRTDELGRGSRVGGIALLRPGLVYSTTITKHSPPCVLYLPTLFQPEMHCCLKLKLKYLNNNHREMIDQITEKFDRSIKKIVSKELSLTACLAVQCSSVRMHPWPQVVSSC